jgi:hypothetical protein
MATLLSREKRKEKKIRKEKKHEIFDFLLGGGGAFRGRGALPWCARRAPSDKAFPWWETQCCNEVLAPVPGVSAATPLISVFFLRFVPMFFPFSEGAAAVNK